MDTPTPGPEDLRRLARAVFAERDAQKASQRVMAQRADVSPLTWISVEKAKAPPRPTTLAAVDRGLGWPEGTAAAVLGGAEPPEPGTHVPQESVGSPTSAAPNRLDEMFEELALLRGAVGRMETLVERMDRRVGALLALAAKAEAEASDGPE
jgi:transcriptional regulator with XRE-family HTH domain